MYIGTFWLVLLKRHQKILTNNAMAISGGVILKRSENHEVAA